MVAKLEERLAESENTFKAICAKTEILKPLINDTLPNNDAYLQQLSFGFFVHVFNDVGNPLLTYWNSNQYYLDVQDVLKSEGNYFINNQNGSFELIKKEVIL